MKISISRLIGKIDIFLPDTIKAAGSIEVARARQLVLISILIGVIVIPFAILRFGYSVPSGPAGWILVAGSLALFCAPVVLKYTGSLSVTLALTGSVLVAVLTSYTQSTGGLFAASLLWYPLFPLLTAFYGGVWLGTFFMAILLGHLAFLYFQQLGLAVPLSIIEDDRYFLIKTLSAATAFVVAFVFGVASNRLNRRAVSSAQDAKESLRVANSQLELRISDRTIELTRSEERYRKLIDHTLQGMVVILDNKILFSNRAEASIFGFDDPQDIIGTQVDKRVAPEYLPSVADYHAACQRGETTVRRYEYRGLRADGSSVWIEALLDTIPWNDKLAIQEVHVDITDRKNSEEERAKLESQLRQAQKMEAVGQLAAGVAHDFNNLLQIIIGRTELAMWGVKDQKQLDSLGAVLDAAKRAAALTRQLLAFGRQQVVDKRELDPLQFINEQLHLMRRVIEERIEIVVTAAPDLWSISGDPMLLGQVLMNLCVNARDAMPRGGRITLGLRTMTLDDEYCRTNAWARPGRYLEIAVADTGEGISPANMDRIFEPFFTTKEVGRGTGLGLSVAAGIVEQHAGLFSVESVPGEGTVFRIFLPAIDGIHGLSEQEVPAVSPGGRETILVVEDEKSVLELAASTLRDAGYYVLEASDGEEAVAKFETSQHGVDLVLLDAVMPKLDGKEVFLRIRNEHPEARFIFCSGYSDHIIGSEFLIAHRIDLLPKPYFAEDLLRAVRQNLDKEL